MEWSPTVRSRATTLLRGLALLALLASPVGADARPPVPDDLHPRYAAWLEEVDLIMTDEEREYFLSLDENFRRDAFVHEFWRVRDPEEQTGRNELLDQWRRRVPQVREDFGGFRDDRAKVFLLHGGPGGFVTPAGEVLSVCYFKDRAMELWFYGGSQRIPERFALLFYQPLGHGPGAPYRLYDGATNARAASRTRLPTTEAKLLCGERTLPFFQAFVQYHGNFPLFIQQVLERPEPASREWVATFAADTAVLPDGAETFDADVAFEFPGRNQSRTAVQGIITLPADQVEAREPPGSDRKVHTMTLNGEVVRDDSRLETFRYRFDLPVGSTTLPLVFQRYLRPGTWRILLKVEDVYGQRYAALERTVEVPDADSLDLDSVPEGGWNGIESGYFALLREANEAAERGQRSIRLVRLPDHEVQLGLVRFTTVSSWDPERVRFLLDDEVVMTKNRPPFSVELDLGDAAASHRLRVEALDPDGDPVASDELRVNQGGQRFEVRFVEPREDRHYRESVSVVLDAEVPDGDVLERIEIFLDDRPVATLYQEPFVQPLLLEDDELAYLRAVAYLEDGATTEDVVFINPPPHFEHIDIEFVELLASVVDRSGNAVLGLGRDDFTVLEDGVEQTLKRFELVRDLPIHAGLLLDTSASMEGRLEVVARAAEAFVEQTMRPKDRMALFSFAERPQTQVRFTNQPDDLAHGLQGLRPRGGTALYDALVYGLYYFDGVKGQKALIVLSDGKDESSRFSLENAIRTAQRTGVTVYVVGLEEVKKDRDAKRALESLAQATGGRAFFIEGLEELPGIYASIQDELRSQYLLAYQSTSTKDENDFRRIEVDVEGRGEVRVPAGYFP
jgi:Ca-activated chloride channel homolog